MASTATEQRVGLEARAPAAREPSGRLIPGGRSLNPHGYRPPSAIPAVSTLAREWTEDCIGLLGAMVSGIIRVAIFDSETGEAILDPKTKEPTWAYKAVPLAERRKAAELLLNRGYGKAPQVVDIRQGEDLADQLPTRVLVQIIETAGVQLGVDSGDAKQPMDSLDGMVVEATLDQREAGADQEQGHIPEEMTATQAVLTQQGARAKQPRKPARTRKAKAPTQAMESTRTRKSGSSRKSRSPGPSGA